MWNGNCYCPTPFAFPFACLAFFVLGLILCWAFGKLENTPTSRRMSTLSTLPIVVVGVETPNKHKAIQVDFTEIGTRTLNGHSHHSSVPNINCNGVS